MYSLSVRQRQAGQRSEPRRPELSNAVTHRDRAFMTKANVVFIDVFELAFASGLMIEDYNLGVMRRLHRDSGGVVTTICLGR